MDTTNMPPEVAAYLQQIFGDMDPQAVIAQIGGLQSQPDRQALMQQQFAQGVQQQGTPSAEGMRVGGTYVAASPLEHLATALTRARGMQQQQQATQGLQRSFDTQDAGRATYRTMAIGDEARRDPLVQAIVGQRLQMQGMGPSTEVNGARVPLFGPGF